MNKKNNLVPNGKKKGVNFVTTKEDNKFYKKWLLAEKQGWGARNPYALKGLAIEDRYLEEFIEMYRMSLGGLSNREEIYVNGVKLCPKIPDRGRGGAKNV